MTKLKTMLFASAKAPAALVAASMALAGCVSPVAGPHGLYAAPIGNAPVTSNPTPYSKALVCLGGWARQNNLGAPRIAVGRIADYTGKAEADGSGRKVTQGASLMAISALAKAGARLVERYDTSVGELELKYANNKLISDGEGEYRKIHAGQVPGSDFYLVGGITELNFNIRSSGIDAFGGDPTPTDTKGNLGARLFVMNVGLDLRLVDSKTFEVVDVISYQKQVIGREVSLGVFDFLNGNVFDISAGEGAVEPLQLAVRAVVERGALEMMANLYGAPGPEVCLQSDPLVTSGVTGNFYPAYDNLGTNNGATREDPSRWNSRRDGAVRGR